MKLGKKGKMNYRANQLIAEIVGRCCLNYCENCYVNWPLAPAHRHKRGFYKTAEQLADFNEWIILCQGCHDSIEPSRERTEAMFKKLRPCNYGSK